jgi:hypothetical protein
MKRHKSYKFCLYPMAEQATLSANQSQELRS